MDSSRLLASVVVALDKLQYRKEQSISRSDEMKLEIMIWGLRVVRTFLLCSTQLTEDNNFTLYSQKQMMIISRMREDLGSLLIGVEDVVRKILDDHTPYQPYDFRYDMESCEDEMDSWYTNFSAYMKKYSTSPLSNQIKAILDSVLENLEDYRISKRIYYFDLKVQLQQIEALKRNITVMRHIICFSALLCTENQEFQCPLINIEPLAISAAHFTHLFFMRRPNDATSSMISALLLKINHACNPHLYVTCSLSTRIKRCLSHSLFASLNKQLQNPSIVLELPGLTYTKMDFSRLLAYTDVALDKLQYPRKHSMSWFIEMDSKILIRKLRVVRTFLLCSIQLTEDNNLTLCSQKQKQDDSRMREDLGSLLIRVEDVVRKILANQTYDLRHDMESCDDAMDYWYTSFSAYLKKYSTSPLTNQIKATLDSVLENLRDYLISKRSYGLDLKEQLQQIEALQVNITVMRRIICFGSLLCTEHQEFQCLLTHIEPLAISAAHLTLRLFHVKGPMQLPKDVITFMVSALILKINHALNPLLHEKYSLALTSLKHSRELCDSTLDLNDYPFIVKLERNIVSLSSDLWEIHLVTRVSLKDLELYDRLGLLRTLLKRQPDIFDDDKIWDLTASTVCDAGIRIFSLGQKDFVNDQSFQDNNKVNWAEVLEGKVAETSRLCKTNVLGFIDFLLEDYLMEVNSSKVDSNTLSCVSKIREHLVLLKSIMGKLAKLRNQHENLNQHVWNLGVAVAYKIEFLIDQLVLGDVLDSFSMSLQSVTENIMTIEADFLKIKNDEGRQEIFKGQQITWPSADKAQSISSGDEVVGFQSERDSIVNRLLRGFKKLKVVAVIGMPGLGKTTLATKVYSNTSISHHFHVKAWCSISQVFDRRKVLLALLNQIQPGKSDSTMKEYDLSQQLWRSLRQRRYLIFIDDVWDTEAFDLLKESLPDDSNQSRILLTSRHSDVVPDDILDDKPLSLRHLTVDESLEILRRKLFPAQKDKDWPLELHEIAMEIAESCKGLPLTIVLVAGLLKTMEQEGWKYVLKTLKLGIISDLTDQCESTIELSYTHLPDHLKPCFLWFGAFPEDHEYSVKRMILLWISEGLVRKNKSKSLEDVGRDYMNNLIARSLVMNGEGRSMGGVKTCRIHDLLHDFCLKKANEEYFLHALKWDGSKEQGEESSGELENLLIDEMENLCCVEFRNLRRLCIHSKAEHLKWKVFYPRLRSLLFFHPRNRGQKLDLSYIFRMFRLLRVLEIDKVELNGFPSEIGALVQLRYLAFHVDEYVDPAIGNLVNLETLILNTGESEVSLPDTFWNLRKLRHLYSPDGYFKFPIDDSNNSCKLLGLQTLSALYDTDWSVLSKFPNIRQMKCWLDLDTDYREDGSKVMDLSFLSQLESLSLVGPHSWEWVFPENIKKLSLCRTILSTPDSVTNFCSPWEWNKSPLGLEIFFPPVEQITSGSGTNSPNYPWKWKKLPQGVEQIFVPPGCGTNFCSPWECGTNYTWEKIARIAKLPNLEVLKLHDDAFIGDTWHVEEGEFPNLKFLKFERLNLVKWTAASDDAFPNLEKLVLQSCDDLEEIPECLENVAALETIEVINCPDDVVSLAKKVYEFHKEMGNSALQFHERGTWQKH